jgi:hypothetical protein
MSEGRDVGRVRRTVARLTGSDQAARLDALERAVKKLTEAQRDEVTAVRVDLAGIARDLQEHATAKDLGEVLRAVRALDAQIDRNVEDQLAHGGVAEQQRLHERRLYKQLDQIAAGDGPILVGPWTGEVGFELLYWVPFLAWARSRWNLAPERHVIVSRGGVASWYGIEKSRYADIFSFVTPQQYRASTDQEEHKQRRTSAFDREMIDAVTERFDLNGASRLQPGAMYRAFMPFWRDEAGFGTIERFTCYRRFEPLSDPALDALPSEYVAARFYFSDCFPDTPENRAFARSVVSALAVHVPVVLLNPGMHVDDHSDYSPGSRDRVFTIGDGLAPDRNLAVQSAVISRARAFIGTYGGYSYLAPFYGVPALAFYSVRSFKLHHLHVAQRVFERLGGATVIPIDVAQAPLVQLTLASVIC